MGKRTQKNKSIDGNKLTVAGQQYDHGLGTHANSDIVYNIPTGAKRFVAVAGTDDEVNENGGYASMFFKVYVDEKLISSSPLVGKGMVWNFDVPLPDGAKQIRLSLNDAGDKNFDHGDWIHAGFMNTGPKVELYTLISDGVLDRSSGIGAKVEVAATPGAEPRQGKQVVLFQLMNDTTPVSIFAIEADPIFTAKEFAAFFDVEDAAQLSYTVKVFVLDQLDRELTASISLAVPTIMK